MDEEEKKYKQVNIIVYIYYVASILCIGMYLTIISFLFGFKPITVSEFILSPRIILLFLLSITAVLLGAGLAVKCFSQLTIYNNKFAKFSTKFKFEQSVSEISNYNKTITLKTKKIFFLYTIALALIQSGSVMGFIGSILTKNAAYYIPFMSIVLIASIFAKPNIGKLLDTMDSEAEQTPVV